MIQARIRPLLTSLASLALALLAPRVWAQTPSSYDLRAVTTGSGVQAWVPAIQNQGIFSDCWTFAAATAIESNLLQTGLLAPQPTPPAVTISSWHISARNGAPESLVSTGTYGNGTADYGWGGFEYQTMGYLTRGQGAWTIPNVPSPQTNYITTMGGGPVTVSGTVNAFPHVLVNNSPANIGDLLPASDQTPAWLTRQVRFLDQGFGGNVPLPAPTHPNGSKYVFNLGAADPQVQAVKSTILAGGAVTTSMNGNSNYFSYTSGTGGLYTVSYVNPGQDPSNTDHEVTIIGWSDSQVVGSGTGAWLVQNSWGTSYWTTSSEAYPNDGTFWASYDDPSIGRTGVAAFSLAPTAGYATTVLQNELGPIGYAYDFNATSTVLGLAADQHTAFSSVLTPTSSGSLAAIGVINGIVGTSLEYSIVSGWTAANPSGGTLLASGSLTLGGVGYQLIDLTAPVPLTVNQPITVLLTYGTGGAAGVVVGGDGLYGVTQDAQGCFSYPVNSGLSYYFDANAGTWTDFATKTYTVSGSTSSADTTGGVLFLKGVMVAPVPEPGTLALAAVGMGVALLPRLRRRGSARRMGSWFPSLFIAAALLLGGREALAQAGYTSPFSITLDSNIASWTNDFSSRLGALYASTTPAQTTWYDPSTDYTHLPYGPLNPQLYSTSSTSIGSPAAVAELLYDRGQPAYDVPLNSPPAGVSATTWQQQRILAAANTLLTAPNGTAYQHLHLPTFDPAQVTSGTGFPWSAVSTGTALQSSWQLANGNIPGTTPNPYAAAYGKPAPGIDCTDFSAYVYSLALGVQMHSGTPNQVNFTGTSGNPAPGVTAFANVLDTAGTPITPQFFYSPNFGTDVHNTGTGSGPLASLVSQFQPGDLLYIGGTNGIRHVVMWLGQTGTDSVGNTFPLVISSHDNTPAIFDTLALDATGFPLDGNIAGHLPPPGVHILPFDQSNWFYQDFQLAMRVIAVPEPSAVILVISGIAAWLWRRRGSVGLATLLLAVSIHRRRSWPRVRCLLVPLSIERWQAPH